jgi:hypothetical protein
MNGLGDGAAEPATTIASNQLRRQGRSQDSLR